MAPIRRYLRITKYSVLEVRIYLDNPGLAYSWLLNPRDPVLPRIIQAVRPLVLPKLREENERAKGKSGKKQKGVKDVVYEEDFEVSIFLTDLSTRHSLLTKQKQFHDRGDKIRSNSGKLTGWLTTGTNDEPIDVEGEGADEASVIIREESEDEGGTKNSGKRRREDSADDLFINDDDVSEDEGFQHLQSSSAKRRKGGEQAEQVDEEDEEDKKKFGLNTSYDGFSIYGRILCLVVKRKGAKGRVSGLADDDGQQMLENWVSTQAAQEQGIEDD